MQHVVAVRTNWFEVAQSGLSLLATGKGFRVVNVDKPYADVSVSSAEIQAAHSAHGALHGFA